MNEDNTAANYLLDLGELVRELVTQARQDYEESNDPDDRQFDRGRLWALYEVTSLMQQQAAAFDLPLSAVSMDGVDPDQDFL